MSPGRAATFVTTLLLLACSKSNDEPSSSATTVPPESTPGTIPELDPDAGAEASSPPPLGACSGTAGKRLRTLIIGNSQIFYWNLPKILSVLSESGPAECPRIDAEGFTAGGANLQYLWDNTDSEGRPLLPMIRDGKYDVVVIAESIDLVEQPPPKARFVTYATRMIEAARAAGARPVLYATPYPDHEDHWGFVEMATPQLELGKATEVPVAASGLAWLRVWKELPSVFLHHTDHAHPGFKGSVISAMVLYAVITRGTPIGLTTAPAVDCEGAPCPRIEAAEGDVFRRAAWEEARSGLGPQASGVGP